MKYGSSNGNLNSDYTYSSDTAGLKLNLMVHRIKEQKMFACQEMNLMKIHHEIETASKVIMPPLGF